MSICLIDGVWWVVEMGRERGDCDPESSELCPLNPTSGRAWLLFLVGEQKKNKQDLEPRIPVCPTPGPSSRALEFKVG